MPANPANKWSGLFRQVLWSSRRAPAGGKSPFGKTTTPVGKQAPTDRFDCRSHDRLPIAVLWSVIAFPGAVLFRMMVAGLFFAVLMKCLYQQLNKESGNEYGKAS